MKEIKKASGKNESTRSLYYFFGSLAAALALTWLLKKPDFTASQLYVLFLLFFAIGLWLTEAIPPFAVALFIMAYLVFALGSPYFNPVPERIDRYVNTFSGRIVWLLLGGFFLASAMTKTKLDEQILRLTLKLSGAKPSNIVVAFMFTAMAFSMIMSAIATTSMMVAALMPLLKTTGKSGLTKALLLGISSSAAIGGMGTIIGSSPNAIAVGILGDNSIKIDFVTWMFYGAAIAVVLTAIVCLVLVRLFVKDSSPVSMEFLEDKKDQSGNESSFQRTVVLIVMIITILLWVTSSLHGISVAGIAAIPIVVFTLTGVITANDIKSLSWDTLFLIAGGLSLGEALQSTGILKPYAVQMGATGMSSITILFIIAYATMIISNIMSHSAATTVMIPLGFALLPGMEKQVAVCIALASSAAIFLPVGTLPNSIVYSTGLLEQKDFRISGLLVGILGPLMAVLWVLFISR
jgi:sodium-dependent dicarboxylate transporter 2/3/5